MRPELLIVLLVALVLAAVVVVAMGSFQPLPLFVGLIAVGVYRSWRASRTNAKAV